ncbi:MAG: group 1 truncated hemoglobin [Acidobacteriota bacterium]
MDEGRVDSLYERIGGADRVDSMTHAFYERVLADPLLAPFFEKSEVDKLHSMQREFFSAALDGPVTYTGLPLTEAHAGRGIGAQHFARFTQHLLDTLASEGLDDREVRDVIERISTYRDEVLGSSSLAG